MGFRFRDVSDDPGYVGNCNLCGTTYPGRKTALIVEWWSVTPKLSAMLLLCGPHAEGLARYAVSYKNIPHIFTWEGVSLREGE